MSSFGTCGIVKSFFSTAVPWFGQGGKQVSENGFTPSLFNFVWQFGSLTLPLQTDTEPKITYITHAKASGQNQRCEPKINICLPASSWVSRAKLFFVAVGFQRGSSQDGGSKRSAGHSWNSEFRTWEQTISLQGFHYTKLWSCQWEGWVRAKKNIRHTKQPKSF